MLNKASEDKLNGVKPALAKIIRLASHTAPGFQIVQGNRTQAYQNALYAQGRTKPGPKVTWTTHSKHIGGNAVDFAAQIDGKINWNAKYYPAIAKHIKNAASALGAKITWGGDWNTKDWGHIQLESAPMTTPQPLLTAPTLPVQPPKVWEPQRAYDALKTAGLPRVAAIAMVANLMWESGGNSKDTIVWDAVGDAGKSHYAGQWNGTRKAEVEALGKIKGLQPTDARVQLEFIPKELKTTEKKAAARLQAATTIEEAVAAAITYWRPSVPHADKRLAIAKRIETRLA